MRRCVAILLFASVVGVGLGGCRAEPSASYRLPLRNSCVASVPTDVVSEVNENGRASTSVSIICNGRPLATSLLRLTVLGEREHAQISADFRACTKGLPEADFDSSHTATTIAALLFRRDCSSDAQILTELKSYERLEQFRLIPRVRQFAPWQDIAAEVSDVSGEASAGRRRKGLGLATYQDRGASGIICVLFSGIASDFYTDKPNYAPISGVIDCLEDLEKEG